MLRKIVRVTANATGLAARKGTDYLIGTVNNQGEVQAYGLIDEARMSYKAGTRNHKVFKAPTFEKRVIDPDSKVEQTFEDYLNWLRKQS